MTGKESRKVMSVGLKMTPLEPKINFHQEKNSLFQEQSTKNLTTLIPEKIIHSDC